MDWNEEGPNQGEEPRTQQDQRNRDREFNQTKRRVTRSSAIIDRARAKEKEEYCKSKEESKQRVILTNILHHPPSYYLSSLYHHSSEFYLGEFQ